MTKAACEGNEMANQREGGFSLIEVLIAMLILVFGIVAVANLMLLAASSNMVANHGTAAVTVATEEMERLKSLTFANVAGAGGTRVVAATTTAGGATARERVTTVQLTTTIRPAGAGLHIIVVATPLNAFNARTYNVGADPDNPPPTRSQAIFTTFRLPE